MNNRIKELMNQTGVPTTIPFDQWCEKFAELIVQECMLAVSKTLVLTEDEVFIMVKCHDQIEKHFGVKE